MLLPPILFIGRYSSATNYCQLSFHLLLFKFTRREEFQHKAWLTVSNKEKLEAVIKRGLFLPRKSKEEISCPTNSNHFSMLACQTMFTVTVDFRVTSYVHHAERIT